MVRSFNKLTNTQILIALPGYSGHSEDPFIVCLYLERAYHFNESIIIHLTAVF